jgi:hypothetical protein
MLPLQENGSPGKRCPCVCLAANSRTTNQELGLCCDIHSSMAPEESPNLAFLLRDGLGVRLRMALVDSFKFSLIAGKGLSVQIFLAALYKSSPSEVALFFSATTPLEKLLQGLSSIDVTVHEIAPVRNPDDHSTRGFHSKIDALLVDLLTKTVNVASQRRAQADIVDFMSIVSNDAEAETLLRNELGLILKSRPA